MTNNEKKDDWRLDKIELEFKSYGNDKGKYVGSIRFQNGEYESFKFNIKHGMAEKYIELMSLDIVEAAELLGSRLIKSLNLNEIGLKNDK